MSPLVRLTKLIFSLPKPLGIYNSLIIESLSQSNYSLVVFYEAIIDQKFLKSENTKNGCVQNDNSFISKSLL